MESSRQLQVESENVVVAEAVELGDSHLTGDPVGADHPLIEGVRVALAATGGDGEVEPGVFLGSYPSEPCQPI